MGTNYYWIANPCETCGRGDERIHIGKSSGGWTFALHVYPDEGIADLPDWEKRFESGAIRDEYGGELTREAMHKIIADRHWQREAKNPSGYGSWRRFHAMNHSVDGPNGLVRADIGYGCIAHGSGTWDLHVGSEDSW